MAFDIGAVIAKIDADISGFTDGMNEAQKKASGFGQKLQNIGASVADFGKQAAIFSGIATAAVVAFGKSSVDSYNESEKQLAQLQAVLKSTGGVAGVTADQAIKLAAAFQKTTTYSDEATLSAENMLLTFTNITKDIFPQATETVLNMSTALGQDTKSSAIQLGKALQDPILGVTALRRVGVNFNEAQAEVIKNLVETGKSAEAQQMILKELATEFGGSAAAAATTFGGQLEILKSRFDDVKEAIGQVIVGFGTMVATDDAGLFADGLQKLGINSQAVVTFFGQFAGALRDFGGWVAENKELVLTFLTGLGLGIGALLVIGTITMAIAAFTNPLFLLVMAITALYTAWQTNFFGIRDITMQVVNEIVAFWQEYLAPAIAAIVATFVANWVYLKDQIDGIWKIIIGIFQVAWAIVYGVIKVGLALLSGDWKAAWDAIVQMAKTAWSGIQNIFNGALQFIRGWGGQLISELVRPFQEAWNQISALVNKIKDALDFTKRHSPSILDIVNSGVSKVNDALGDLAWGPSINATAAGLAVSRGGDQSSTTIVRIDMAGAMIADTYGAQQMAEIIGDGIVKRLQQNVRV